MQNLNYWMQFENTGRVEDYLAYCSLSAGGADGEKVERNAALRTQQTGVDSYAGIPMGNGNRIETDAYR